MEIKFSKSNLVLLKTFVVMLLLGFVLIVIKIIPGDDDNHQDLVLDEAVSPCVPAFADGDGPYYLTDQPFRDKLAAPDTTGQKLIISGKMVQSDCKTLVPNAVLDIWHADNLGEYRNEWYRGQITTNEKGEFYFETVQPSGYGEGTGYRPPHIHFKIFINGQLVRTSEMFFNDTRDKEGFNNAYIVSTHERDGVIYGNYNIVLP